MRITDERTPWAAIFFGCAVIVPSLCGCLAGLTECFDEVDDVDGGTEVDGLSTDGILTPLVGDHVATLTWLRTSQTTTLRLHVERAGGVAKYDCESHFEGFEIRVNGRISTDDGVIASMTDGGASDPTLSSAYFATDAAGRANGEPTFGWRFDFATLVAAGVVDPSLMDFAVPSDVPGVGLSVTTMHLKPIDSGIQVTSAELSRPVSVATIHFSS